MAAGQEKAQEPIATLSGGAKYNTRRMCQRPTQNFVRLLMIGFEFVPTDR